MSTKKLVSLLFLAFIIVSGSFYYLRHRDEFHLITTLSMGSVLVLSLLIVLQLLIYGLQLKTVTDHFNLPLTFLQCFGLSRITAFINLWTPIGGGASFKAVYLKKYHNLNYSAYIASMGIVNVIHISVNSMAAMILLLLNGGKIAMLLFSVAGVVFISASSFLLLGHKLDRYAARIIKYSQNIFDEWENLRKDRRSLVKLVLLSLVIFMISAASIYFLFRSFSVQISLLASGTIAAFSIITGMVNLLPGNIGIREAVIITISRVYGIEVNESLHAAALGRILSIIWTFFLVPLSKYSFSEKGKKYESLS